MITHIFSVFSSHLGNITQFLREKIDYISIIIIVFLIVYLFSDKGSISRCINGIFFQQDLDQCRLLGKTFWDWLKLGVTPILVFYLSRWFQEKDNKKAKKDQKKAKKKAKKEQKIEKQKIEIYQKEQAFQDYIDRISKLLIDNKYQLNKSEEDDPVKNIARIWTTTILRRLERDEKIQDRVIHFLRDTELLFYILQKSKLDKVDLFRANLREANFAEADLRGANLREANFAEADLRGANLIKANLVEAVLFGADLRGADLVEADLRRAYLTGANLFSANLCSANLSEADLRVANLSEVKLEGAKLEGAKLEGANLYTTKFLDIKQLKSATNWEKAIYTKAKLEFNDSMFQWVPIDKIANEVKIKQIRDSTKGYVKF